MKRTIALLLAVVFGLSLATCGTDNSASSPRTDAPTQATGSNVLIAYFSVPEDVDTVDAVAGASIMVRDGEKLGNTEYVAKLIQETVGGVFFALPIAASSILQQLFNSADIAVAGHFAESGYAWAAG